jgi:hypothetical protein
MDAAAAEQPASMPVQQASAAVAHQGGSHAHQQYAPSQFTINRRPPIELSLPYVAGKQTGPADEHGLDLSTTLDVPAFLRRQS